MIVQLIPKYKFICDRCGKETYTEDNTFGFEVAFIGIGNLFKMPQKVKGRVCCDCMKDFYEIAGNFFDSVNKRSEDEK